MIHKRLIIFLLLITACSSPVETSPRVFVQYALVPVSFGRLVQTINALRMVSARSDPMQAAFGAALAHIVSIWYGWAPFDEDSQNEEAYLLGFCKAVGWKETSIPDCARRIYQTILEQTSHAVFDFSQTPSLKEDAENLILEIESLRQEPQLPSLAIWSLGDKRVQLASAHRRRLPAGLLVMIQENNFSVFGSTAIPITNVIRIREILDHAAALESPAGISLFVGADEPLGPVLMVLGIARAAGISRIWAWGVHHAFSAAVDVELVDAHAPFVEIMPKSFNQDTENDGIDISEFSTWGQALHFVSTQKTPLRMRIPLQKTQVENFPSLQEIRKRLVSPEP